MSGGRMSGERLSGGLKSYDRTYRMPSRLALTRSSGGMYSDRVTSAVPYSRDQIQLFAD